MLIRARGTAPAFIRIKYTRHNQICVQMMKLQRFFLQITPMELRYPLSKCDKLMQRETFVIFLFNFHRSFFGMLSRNFPPKEAFYFRKSISLTSHAIHDTKMPFVGVRYMKLLKNSVIISCQSADKTKLGAKHESKANTKFVRFLKRTHNVDQHQRY